MNVNIDARRTDGWHTRHVALVFLAGLLLGGGAVFALAGRGTNGPVPAENKPRFGTWQKSRVALVDYVDFYFLTPEGSGAEREMRKLVDPLVERSREPGEGDFILVDDAELRKVVMKLQAEGGYEKHPGAFGVLNNIMERAQWAPGPRTTDEDVLKEIDATGKRFPDDLHFVPYLRCRFGGAGASVVYSRGLEYLSGKRTGPRRIPAAPAPPLAP